jgi:hypothetical protein
MPTLANMEKVNGIVISGAAAPTDRHILLGTQTASSSATLSFSGINSHRSDVLRSSFDVLEFRFTNMNPQTMSSFQFQVNASDGTGFNDSLITSTHFRTYHRESGDTTHGPAYNTGLDQAQVAGYQPLSNSVDNGADSGCSGILTLYAPSSVTYVKHFTAMIQTIHYTDYSQNSFTAGYINDTTAIDEISFMFSSGNIDAGVIKMYGIAKA